ncbi:pyridoxamine 5'-phosphate oxidase family protein [uncultured Propionibacterium sp.]|uniref:pyridoxamine 5'-phosphate oxidase family protein n=1 Tax=uncultured Propionibacterium sp. TaxID=218066 RepID=UPI00292CF725|nr:pyridoxamine 5'-phosphate oxidase family protein [uncultured Propionibacterium sp.]
MVDTTNPVSEIPEGSAWGYLASVDVGRIAVTSGDSPEIYPVNFCLDGESIVFRSASGSKLETLALNSRVAFEADSWADEGGWSVLVRGTATLVEDADELARVAKAPLRTWVPTVKKNWVRVVPSQITARRFAFGPEPRA